MKERAPSSNAQQGERGDGLQDPKPAQVPLGFPLFGELAGVFMGTESKRDGGGGGEDARVAAGNSGWEPPFGGRLGDAPLRGGGSFAVHSARLSWCRLSSSPSLPYSNSLSLSLSLRW